MVISLKQAYANYSNVIDNLLNKKSVTFFACNATQFPAHLSNISMKYASTYTFSIFPPRTYIKKKTSTNFDSAKYESIYCTVVHLSFRTKKRELFREAKHLKASVRVHPDSIDRRLIYIYVLPVCIFRYYCRGSFAALVTCVHTHRHTNIERNRESRCSAIPTAKLVRSLGKNVEQRIDGASFVCACARE